MKGYTHQAEYGVDAELVAIIRDWDKTPTENQIEMVRILRWTKLMRNGWLRVALALLAVLVAGLLLIALMDNNNVLILLTAFTLGALVLALGYMLRK